MLFFAHLSGISNRFVEGSNGSSQGTNLLHESSDLVVQLREAGIHLAELGLGGSLFISSLVELILAICFLLLIFLRLRRKENDHIINHLGDFFETHVLLLEL